MPRTLTITLSEDVYQRLHDRIGPDHISRFIENLLRAHVIDDSDLEEGYRAAAADEEREREALEWIEATPDARLG